MNGHAILYALLVVMVTLWSSNFIIAKVALREFPPLLLTGLRVALAGAFISPLYFWNGRREETSWKLADVPVLIYLGVFGVALNQFFFVMGISRTSVAHAAIFMGATPICVLLIAAILKLERITPGKAIGMIIALGGVAMLTTLPAKADASGAAPSPLGDVFIFCSSLAFSLFTVLGKRMTARHSAVTVNTFAYVGGAVALAPITLWYGSRFSFSHVSLGGWVCLLYMALFPSVICYLIYYYALSHIAASRVSAFSYLQPPIATAMAVALLGEHVSLPLVAGAAITFFGIYLTERSR